MMFSRNFPSYNDIQAELDSIPIAPASATPRERLPSDGFIESATASCFRALVLKARFR
jgi:hypothetical protein